eukprot:CAMPEP_0115865220 /NCGR_PEP_ID=MMETSP0287-20121206/19607_1 /TAXON_ID=412157 /ORGANISM="Chrysochromulina rotalis, Strain UIO044" /LENGTH=281 /DNA_ID=CAMNT_0003319721 /DNA_START=10 /DNA_END=855 /DNA_ORIENTATION=+
MRSTTIVVSVFLLLGRASSLRMGAMPLSVQSAGASQSTSAALISRRGLLAAGGALSAFSAFCPSVAHADDKQRVVIFGGSGYVGAYASQMLLKEGVEVISVSRKSPEDQAEKVKAILGSSLAVNYEQLDASSSDLAQVLKGASAVISCVGIAPGGANQRDGNGLVNAKIADAAKAAGVEKFVYLGVASELSNGPIKFIFGDYVKGKAEAEAAVKKDFGSAALVIKPGIIAGAPPGEIRPPGPPGMTPVAVQAVASAVVAGALGQKSGFIDGNDAITAAVSP